MKLLLDTHVFLWFVVAALGSDLPAPTKELLEDENNELFLSVASIWEAAIKISIGKLHLPQPVVQITQLPLQSGEMKLLNITLAHLALIETMPLHHKDPFDRLLVAQAQVEKLPIVSIDTTLDLYGINRIWLT